MESVEYIAVVSLPTKVMDEVEIDDKDDRSKGVKIYHLSVVRTPNPEHEIFLRCRLNYHHVVLRIP
jgi:hypothetical protein